MPIMKTQSIRLHGGFYIRRVKWDGRESKFFIEIPDYISMVTEVNRIVGDTMPEVVAQWDGEIRKYDLAKTTKKKVIVYKISGHHNLNKGKAAKPLEPKKRGKKGEEEDDGFVDFCDRAEEMEMDAALHIEYWVGYEVKVEQEKNYIDIYGFSKTVWVGHLNDEDQVIEWTADREAFFEATATAIADAHKRVEKFFKQSKKKLLAAIGSKQRLIGMG